MAFEPIPSLFGAIAKKFGSRVEVFPFALSDEEGKTEFNFVRNAPAYSGLRKRKYEIKNPDIEVIDVELRPLDSLVPADRKIDLIKIDVEGAELEVLQSLETIIKIATPFILMEILPVYNTENRYRIDRQEKIEILLSQLDYSIYRIIKSKSISFERIESIEVHSDIDKCDYIFVPNNKVTAFSNLPK